MLAHVAGMPFEEWILPAVATTGSIVFVLRAMIHRVHRNA